MFVQQLEKLNFVPTKVAADKIGYALDYISRLAREGKITAELRGRQWFVDMNSVKLFQLQSESEKRNRSEDLREERLREMANSQKSVLFAVQSDKISASASTSLVLSFIFFVCFSLFGGLSIVAYQEDLDLRAFSLGSGDVYNFFYSWFFPVEQTTNIALDNNSSGEAKGLIVLNEETTEQQKQSIRDSFSDAVEINFTDEDSGIIKPVFSEKSNEAYQFLMVPVKEDIKN